MGYKDITAGEKTAKPLGARFIKSTNKATPAIEVSFEFEEPTTGTREQLTWQAWLTEGAMKHSMNTLVNVLGYNGSEETNENGEFTDPKVLNFDKEVKLVVEMETFETDQGETKEVPKIKYVNSIGGSKFTGCSPTIVKQSLKEVGFKAAFMEAKQKNKDSEKMPF